MVWDSAIGAELIAQGQTQMPPLWKTRLCSISTTTPCPSCGNFAVIKACGNSPSLPEIGAKALSQRTVFRPKIDLRFWHLHSAVISQGRRRPLWPSSRDSAQKFNPTTDTSCKSRFWLSWNENQNTWRFWTALMASSSYCNFGP